ncbi:DUF305 domain-containing protein [Microbacterium schleiferi]|uniref:DUF305 domain-containing protein n=1 Tax=Microbacterium schleiferi TaxID=69362 RepID=UPI002B4BB4E7|nr:DUF305 domain-containing protein [Microbacterium schleiferi]
MGIESRPRAGVFHVRLRGQVCDEEFSCDRLGGAAACVGAGACRMCGCRVGFDAGHGSQWGHDLLSVTLGGGAGEFNTADSMFAMMMIPHHQQAVEMSDMLLGKSGVDQQVMDLAQQIKDAQAPEIDLMQSWLEAWGMSDAGGMDGMDMGDGMMSDGDMAVLESAEGADAARLFLEQMITHHEGAIEMAQAELADGVNPDAIALAQTIVDAQTTEIALMRDLLTQI